MCGGSSTTTEEEERAKKKSVPFRARGWEKDFVNWLREL